MSGNRMNLVIPPEMEARLIQAAGMATVKEGRQVSVSEIVRRAVDAYLSAAAS